MNYYWIIHNQITAFLYCASHSHRLMWHVVSVVQTQDHYMINCRRRASVIANLLIIWSVLGERSRCDCRRTSASSLSSSILRIVVAVLSTLLKTRSGSAVVTGSVASICSSTFMLANVSPLHALRAATAVLTLLASSTETHFCFHMANSAVSEDMLSFKIWA